MECIILAGDKHNKRTLGNNSCFEHHCSDCMHNACYKFSYAIEKAHKTTLYSVCHRWSLQPL